MRPAIRLLPALSATAAAATAAAALRRAPASVPRKMLSRAACAPSSFSSSSGAPHATTKPSSFTSKDSIYAVSSGIGKAGVAVIRVSGPHAHAALRKLTKGREVKSKEATTRRLYDPKTGDMLDHALVLRFDGPASFTGEDVVELHVHGGLAVMTGVLNALSTIEGLRHAQPGEFTRRAFTNDKFDLTEVEGLADLINAETEAQRKQALRHLGGESSVMYNRWRKQLLECMAFVEAYIDFSEEEAIEDDTLDRACAQIKRLRDTMKMHIEDNRCGERLRQGVEVSIVGVPDVGKSSLLNILCQRNAAIVAAGPGTTRDVVEVRADVAGFPVILRDTAGIRYGDHVSPVEQEGVKRAVEASQTADVRLCVKDVGKFPDEVCSAVKGGKLECFCLKHATIPTIVLLNKIDLLSDAQAAALEKSEGLPENFTLSRISCETKAGMSDFKNVLAAEVKQCCTAMSSEGPVIAHSRHRHHVQLCIGSLDRALALADTDVVMMAEELRLACEQFGYITGRLGIEEILDVVFSEFCIGK